MPEYQYSCPRCPRRFESIEEAREHKAEDHDEPLPDGGAVTLDGKTKYRVGFSSGGIRFYSEPVDAEIAEEYASKMSDVVVKHDLGERPFMDEDCAGIIPVGGNGDE